MDRNSRSFSEGSNTNKHPEEVNAQNGAQNAQAGEQRASTSAYPPSQNSFGGSNTHQHPEEVNAQTGAQNAQTGITQSKTVSANGIQVNDYGFMAFRSTVSRFDISNPVEVNAQTGAQNAQASAQRASTSAYPPSQNSSEGSNTHQHPEDVNAQTGAQNAQAGAQRVSTSASTPLPSSIAKYTTVSENGIQVNDYGFMAAWSTVDRLSITNPVTINNSGNKKADTIDNGLDKNVSMPSNPSPNPQKGNSGEPQNNSNELTPRNIDIDAVKGDQISFTPLPLDETCNAPNQRRVNGSEHMELDQPHIRQGITAWIRTILLNFIFKFLFDWINRRLKN
ncbi:hypothetical protein F0562_012350 [Nyssa sinensis]|uniref:Uncharacterized protein n=1 Tax=Nyssa sinensis TaxID=561372 RepID=A0A5J4ZTF6_9ASTE|nr:hypothetical protein F0562_012350 [Nyssa sinensis]